ncbi:MAG: glycosyltransferase [Marinoscillum sp.]
MKEKTQDLQTIIPYKRTFFHKVVDRLYRLFKSTESIKTDPDYFFYGHLKTSRFPTFRTIKKQIDFKPDVVLVFWVSDFITNRVIKLLHNRFGSKIIFIPPDAALFTGGCHYPNRCTNYKTGCNDCPAIITLSQQWIARSIYIEKSKLLQKSDYTVVSVSSFLTQMAVSSGITKNVHLWKQFVVVDDEVFQPIKRLTAARNLSLGANKRYVLLAAAFLKQKRKGILEAVEALNYVWSQNQDYEVLLIGNASDEFEKLYNGEVHVLGYMDPSHLNDLYNISYLYLCPSLEDAGPMMVNQSLMTGTPVVGFKMGVLPDLIRENETGCLADLGDIEGLAEGILKLLNLSEGEYLDMSENCRDLALKSYSPETILNNFQRLFNELSLNSTN